MDPRTRRRIIAEYVAEPVDHGILAVVCRRRTQIHKVISSDLDLPVFGFRVSHGEPLGRRRGVTGLIVVAGNILLPMGYRGLVVLWTDPGIYIQDVAIRSCLARIAEPWERLPLEETEATEIDWDGVGDAVFQARAIICPSLQ